MYLRGKSVRSWCDGSSDRSLMVDSLEGNVSFSNTLNTFLFMAYLYAHTGGARGSSVVRVFAHGAMGRRIDPSWWTHWKEMFHLAIHSTHFYLWLIYMHILGERDVALVRAFTRGVMGRWIDPSWWTHWKEMFHLAIHSTHFYLWLIYMHILGERDVAPW